MRLGYSTFLFAAPSTYRKEADLRLENGRLYRFVENPDGATYTPPVGRADYLVKNGDGTWDFSLQRSGTVYHFAIDGSLSSVKDEFGNLQNWTYDGNGRLQRITDAISGRYIDVFFGADGRISTVQDSGGRQVQYGYDATGLLTNETDPASRVTHYSYSPGRFVPLLSGVTDNWNRGVTSATYDTSDRTTSYTENGETYTYTYKYQGNSALTAKNYGSNSGGNPWVFTFGTYGLVSQEAAPAGSGAGTRSKSYDADGRLQLVTDEVGVNTLFIYDAGGNVASITRDYQGPNAVRFDYAYDPVYREKPVSITPRNPSTNQLDPNWQGWRYDYYQPGDPAPGALHHVYRVENDGVTSDLIGTFTYDSAGRVLSQTSASGGVTDYAYDPQGGLQMVTTPSNNDAGQRPVTTYGYDALGRTTSVTDPLGHATNYTYDALSRVLTVTLPKPSVGSPLNFTTTYSYDNYDSVSGLTFTNVTDPNAIVTKQGYDQFGRLVKSIDGLNNVTNNAYSHGLLSSITDANNNATSFSYDVLRRLSATNFPEGNSETYSYYADGQLHTKTDRKNQTVTYGYDHLKRPSTKSYPDSTSIAYTYSGQLLTQIYDTSTNPSETNSFQYDPSYRVATNVQGSRGTLIYQFNSDDSVSSGSVQGGPTTSYTYYPNGALDTIGWTPVSGPFKFTYTMNCQYQTITMPNGQRRNYSYDDQGRLLQLANLHPTAGTLATYGYGYDLNNTTGQYTRLGQRVSMTADVPSQGFAGAVTSYSFDQNYQLVQAGYPPAAPFGGEVDSWQYDAIGNRLTNTINGTPQNYSYLKNLSNPLNGQRLSNDGSNAYTYDANGSILTKSGPASYSLGWDLENRLSGISGAVTASYTHDFLGRRSSKSVESTTSYVYTGLDLIQELGMSPADYVIGPGIDEPLAMSRGGQVYYPSVDALGSVSLVTDSSGTVQDSYLYDAWGTTRSRSGSLANGVGYAGREFGESSDWFYRARYYNPGIGRFTAEDPMRFRAAPNLFAYVSGNPIARKDPLGLQWQVVIDPGTVDKINQIIKWYTENSDYIDVAAGSIAEWWRNHDRPIPIPWWPKPQPPPEPTPPAPPPAPPTPPPAPPPGPRCHPPSPAGGGGGYGGAGAGASPGG
jgi:RHS repeat-associated protein